MFRKITRKKLENFLIKHSSNKRVLDIGSGASSYSSFFPNRVTVDIDPLRKPNIVADAHNLPFKDEEFEMIICTEVLEHLIDPKKAISEMKRVLVSGGTVVLTTRFVYPLHDTPHDYWRFTKYGLQELFKDWNMVELIPETRSFSGVGVLLQRMAFQGKFRFDKFVKLTLFVTAWILNKINSLIVSEYGSILKNKSEFNIMTSGYYLVARKP